jgi:1,2-diacylglycerol 3-alpha-glucosyltransferase
MRQRVVLLTEIIAPYRIPVFNALSRHEDMALHVIFLAETDEKLRQWPVYKNEICFSYQVLPSLRCRIGQTNLLFNRGLWSALNKIGPQAIICGGYNYAASWEALVWARRHGAAFVLWSESNGQDARSGRPGVEWLKAYFLRHCNGFVVPGKASFEYLKSLRSAETGIVTAPNAVDNDFYAHQAAKIRAHAGEFREKLKLPQRYVLFVGRMVAEKGIFDLLEAYAKLDDDLRSQLGLVFVGEGVRKDELARRAQRVSPGTVSVLGFAQRDDLAGLYALAEVLVLPTHSEPWGLVVNEAMACGLPIIVSSVAGCSADLIADGGNGYVVPPRDPEKLSSAISLVVRQPELQRQMSLCSLERIRSYSSEACANGLAAAAIHAVLEAR